METADKNGRKYLKENNQGVQIDSDTLREDVTENSSVATPGQLDGYFPHWRNAIPCPTRPSVGRNKALMRSKKRGCHFPSLSSRRPSTVWGTRFRMLPFRPSGRRSISSALAIKSVLSIADGFFTSRLQVLSCSHSRKTLIPSDTPGSRLVKLARFPAASCRGNSISNIRRKYWLLAL